MTQTIRFEYDTFPLVMDARVLSTINQLAEESPDKDIRINDDGNMKVYVGDLNAEEFRYWVYLDGRVILTEENVGTTEVSAWRAFERPLIPTS